MNSQINEQNNIFKQKPKIALSACLAGQAVRYDGNHKFDKNIAAIFATLETISLCPEAKLGVPRPAIRLINNKNTIKAITLTNPETDVTNSIYNYYFSVAPTLALVNGYIFKSKSPSCGLTDTTIEIHKTNCNTNPKTKNHVINKLGQGIFSKKVCSEYNLLPIIDEKVLLNPIHMICFIEALYCHLLLQKLELTSPQQAQATDLSANIEFFHNIYYERLLIHSPDLTIKLTSLLRMQNTDIYKYVKLAIKILKLIPPNLLEFVSKNTKQLNINEINWDTNKQTQSKYTISNLVMSWWHEHADKTKTPFQSEQEIISTALAAIIKQYS